MNLSHSNRRLARFFVTWFAASALTVVAVAPQTAAARNNRGHTETAVFAGGCFWGMEAVFESLNGVNEVVSGYAGGKKETASYEQVSTGQTGHAEAVNIHYDPATISYGTLLQVYFLVAHDPTERDRQGPDEGSQYRSVIFYDGDAQRRSAREAIATLTNAKTFRDPIVTQVVQLHGFFPAEPYHQHFAEHNPNYPYIIEYDAPKIRALRQRFPGLVKGAL